MINTYPSYVYNSNSLLYNHIENYEIYLESKGVAIEESRLIKMEELEMLGCSTSSYSCREAPNWIYATSYWTGTIRDSKKLWYVITYGEILYGDDYDSEDFLGIRPVIKILKFEFN